MNLSAFGPITVVGGGAMGCLFGALLSEAGNTVTIVDISPEVVSAIAGRGIELEWETDVRRIRGIAASDSFSAVRGAALVLVFVKSSATRVVADAIGSYIMDGAVVLTLQNGLGNAAELAARLPESCVAAGVTGCGATSLGPGRIRLAGLAETVIGQSGGAGVATLKTVAALFAEAGFPTRVSADVDAVIWTKLMANVGINAITALTGLKNGQVATEPEAWELASRAVAEAAAVAAASGIALETEAPAAHVRAIAEATALNDSSMLQDVRAQRMTEIEVINGEIARLGARLGVATPVNAMLASLVRLRHLGYGNL